MAFLPDELWSKVFELGVTTSRLSCRDLCALAITCRRHNRLSCNPSLWSILLALNFPQPISSSSYLSLEMHAKKLYELRFERDKKRRISACRRAVLFVKSQISVCNKRLKDLEQQLLGEGERMKTALQELNNLERIRQASVALNVWQPELVRGSQKQIVEQCSVPIESRLNSLKMEVNLCKLKIETYRMSLHEENKKLSESQAVLSSLKYNPLGNNHMGLSQNDSSTKWKKLKRSYCSEISWD